MEKNCLVTQLNAEVHGDGFKYFVPDFESQAVYTEHINRIHDMNVYPGYYKVVVNTAANREEVDFIQIRNSQDQIIIGSELNKTDEVFAFTWKTTNFLKDGWLRLYVNTFNIAYKVKMAFFNDLDELAPDSYFKGSIPWKKSKSLQFLDPMQFKGLTLQAGYSYKLEVTCEDGARELEDYFGIYREPEISQCTLVLPANNTSASIIFKPTTDMTDVWIKAYVNTEAVYTVKFTKIDE